MNCRSCGYQLPPEAKVCPHCGTPVPAYSSDSETASSDPTVESYRPQPESSPTPDPTVAAAPSSTPPYLASTGYGSDPYAPADQQNRYPPPPGSPYSYSPAPFPPPNPTPYAPPQAGSYPPFPPAGPQGPQGQQAPRRSSTGLIVLLIILVVLLIGGSGLIYYIAVYNPNQLHTQATATAVVRVTGTAQAMATSTALARVQMNATATAVAENPYTHNGTLALFDPLSDNSKGVNWAQDPTNCSFKDGAYHDNASDPRFSDYCLANSSDFNNFAFEVQMQLVKGDSGGIVFRAENTSTANKLYAFYVGVDGSYTLNRQNGSSFPVLANGNNAAIKQGLNQTNVVAVVAQGSTITLFVNRQQITSLTDGTFLHGQIGFIAGAFGNSSHPTEAAFSNAKVWTL